MSMLKLAIAINLLISQGRNQNLIFKYKCKNLPKKYNVYCPKYIVITLVSFVLNTFVYLIYDFSFNI